MAFSPAFTATESLANPNLITFVDTSTGEDLTLTNRRIYVRIANGNWLTASGESTTIAYTDWMFTDNSTVVPLLTQTTSPSIRVDWLAGDTVLYSTTEEFCFNLYDYLFGLQVLQGNTSSPDQVQDSAYWNSLIQFVVNIFNEESAIEFGGDIFSSQGAATRNLVFINNENYLF